MGNRVLGVVTWGRGEAKLVASQLEDVYKWLKLFSDKGGTYSIFENGDLVESGSFIEGEPQNPSM